MTDVFYVSYGVLWVLVVFLTLVTLGLTRTLHDLRQTGLAAPAGEGLQGAPVPAFTATTLDGETIDAADVGSTALLFASPDCQTCSVTLAELEALRSKVHGRVIVVCRSEPERCEQMMRTYDLAVPVIADADLSLSRTFGVAAAPTAVLIDAAGRIDSYGQPMNPEEFETLLRQQQAKDEDRLAATDHQPLTVVTGSSNGASALLPGEDAHVR